MLKVFPPSQLSEEAALNEALSLGTVDTPFAGAAFLGQSLGPVSISGCLSTLRPYGRWKAHVNLDLFNKMAAEYKNISGDSVSTISEDAS